MLELFVNRHLTRVRISGWREEDVYWVFLEREMIVEEADLGILDLDILQDDQVHQIQKLTLALARLSCENEQNQVVQAQLAGPIVTV